MCELPEKVLGGSIVMPPPSRVPLTPPPMLTQPMAGSMMMLFILSFCTTVKHVFVSCLILLFLYPLAPSDL